MSGVGKSGPGDRGAPHRSHAFSDNLLSEPSLHSAFSQSRAMLLRTLAPSRGFWGFWCVF